MVGSNVSIMIDKKKGGQLILGFVCWDKRVGGRANVLLQDWITTKAEMELHQMAF